MRGRPSESEIHRRIADLLMSPDAGRAVAGHLQEPTDERARRAAIVDRRSGRMDARQEMAQTGPRDAVPDGVLDGARRAELAL